MTDHWTRQMPDPFYWGNEWDRSKLSDYPRRPWAARKTPAPAPGRPLGPRCGRVLVLDGRFERAGIPGDPGDPPVCGRPAGHAPAANGSPGCRSEAAVARKNAADNADTARARRDGRYPRYRTGQKAAA